jgi:hypothetical protein
MCQTAFGSAGLVQNRTPISFVLLAAKVALSADIFEYLQTPAGI